MSTEGAILAENIKSLMQEKHLNAPALAKQIGVPYTSLLEWLKQGSFPREKNLSKLARYFHVSPPYLLTEHREDAPVRTTPASAHLLGQTDAFWQIARLASGLNAQQQEQALKVLKAVFNK